MKAQIELLSKRTYKSKSNGRLLLAVLGMILILLVMNFMSRDEFSLLNDLNTQIIGHEEVILRGEEILNNDEVTDLNQQELIVKDIEAAKNNLRRDQAIISFLEDDNYVEAYQLMSEKMSDNISLVEENPELYGPTSSNLLDAIERDRLHGLSMAKLASLHFSLGPDILIFYFIF